MTQTALTDTATALWATDRAALLAAAAKLPTYHRGITQRMVAEIDESGAGLGSAIPSVITVRCTAGMLPQGDPLRSEILAIADRVQGVRA